jgi:hypothetical protein
MFVLDLLQRYFKIAISQLKHNSNGEYSTLLQGSQLSFGRDLLQRNFKIAISQLKHNSNREYSTPLQGPQLSLGRGCSVTAIFHPFLFSW